MRTYRTQSGDTWDGIALRMYPNIGGEKLMSTLIEVNPSHVETVVFSAGIVLVVPDVDIPIVSDLPPWKR